MASATRKQKHEPVRKGKPVRPAKSRRAAAAPARKPRPPARREPERSSPALAEVDAEVLEFIAAIDRFKQQHGRPFPSWSEVLVVVRELGYRRG